VEIYVVQPGDTLYLIAQRFGTTVAALQELNRFPNPDQLVVGQAILIPGPSPIPLRYTVVRGDTLYLIAQTFGTTVDAIAQANNIADPNRINIGDQLLIPGWSQQTYTIRSGDTLYQIANNFGIPLNLLVKTNNIANPALIYPGQILIIPQRSSIPARKDIETMAYFQLVNLSGLERSLAQMGQYITYGVMFQYPVTPQGTITISSNTTRAVDILRRFNIQPLPSVTNWTQDIGFDPDLARTVMGDTALRRQTIASILALVQQYGFAGINVDFENMYPEDRPLYNNFIRELAETMRANGYITTIAVAPKASDLPNAPWVGAFDYATLGSIVDIMFIMTYEWGWVGGPPMAIAPLPQVRQVIQYAASLMSPLKIIQGVPLYGYDWPLPDTPESQASAVSLDNVYNIAYRYGAVINYDTVAQSPWFRYINEQRVEHEVWFEDARSVQAKYLLARDFNLRGVGYWGYVNEPFGFPQNWPILNEIFNIIKYPS